MATELWALPFDPGFTGACLTGAAGDFLGSCLALAFLTGGFLAGDVLASGLLAGDFLAEDFLADDFLADDFLCLAMGSSGDGKLGI
jgi:hypothetical protein